jgi:uncharacterized protein YcbK (DUF882 family)
VNSLRHRLFRHRSVVLFLAAALLLLAQFALASPPPSAPAPAEVLFRGRSGALRALVVPPGESLAGHLTLRPEASAALRWTPVSTGTAASAQALKDDLRAPEQPGIWRLALTEGEDTAAPTVITPVHFDGAKTHLNGYHIGRYPARQAGRTGRYAPPEHFIEVTQQNQDFALSEHFRLRQFLTKDQGNVWPKYLALDLRLVDKLELVLQELRAQGFPAKRMHVMSGFRTPQYNGPGGKGRAKFSRHTYGDAADVWLDDDGDGQMDDLDRNGRVDQKDAEVLAKAVERVEQRHPELTGGYGVYPANSAHGPFVHIDVRGTAARWSKR